MKNTLIISLIVILALFTFSCQNKTNSSEQPSEYDTLMVQFNSMYGTKSNLQSTSEILIQSGIKYNADLTIDTLIKSEYYKTREKAALMCGVYSADALYHSAFGNSDKSFESYTSAQVLANYLGIGPFYVEHLLKRRDSGLTESDSLLFKFNDILAKFDTSLAEEQRFKIVASYLLGNLIEKLHLIDKGVLTLEGMEVTDISNQAKFLFQLLISEEKTINLFIDILDKYSNEKENTLYIEMINLQTLYKELNTRGIPDYKPGDVFLLTDEMKNISSQIEKVRNLIVLVEE